MVEPTRLPAVALSLDRLNAVIAKHHHTLDALESRLEPVCAPGPGVNKGTSATSPISCQIDGLICQSIDSIEGATARLLTLLDRLQV